MEYFQGTTTAVASLSWSSTKQTKQIISQNQLYLSIPPLNWNNTATGSTLAWSTAGNWTGGVAPTGTADALVRFLGGLTASAGTLTADCGTSAFKLNALQLSGTASSTSASTVALTGGMLQFDDASSGSSPFITLDASKSGSVGMSYTVANALNLGDYTTILGDGTAAFTFSGPVNGSYGLRKQGNAALTLAGSNIFAGGPVTIENGVLALGHLNALSGAGTVYVESGGQLATANTPAANGTLASVPVNLNGNGASATNVGGALRFNRDTASIVWPGGITLGSDTQVTFYSAGGAYTFSSPITGSGALRFHGGGSSSGHYHTVILPAASNYTGSTTVYGDAANLTLKLSGGVDRLPTTTVLALAGDKYPNALRGWLDLNGNDQTLGGNTSANGARGFGDNRVVNGATATLATLTINNTADCTFAGSIGGGSGDSRNSINLSKLGTGTLTLTGVNTYTGNTRVGGGTLALGTAVNDANANPIAGTPVIEVGLGAVFDVSAVKIGYASGAGQMLQGIGTVVGALTISGSHQPGVGGIQNLGNGVTYATTAHRVWQLLANVTTGAGISFDQVAVKGAATVKTRGRH